MSKQQFPEPTTGALVFNKKKEILLIKSAKWHGKYVMPGGHIELGEKYQEALKREIKEETGLSISKIDFICFQEFIFDKAFWKKKHFIFLDFSCQTKSSKVTLNSEGQKYVWVSLEKALKMPIEPYTRQAIKAYLKKSPLSVKKNSRA